MRIYIGLKSKSVMVLGSEVIWTMECSTGQCHRLNEEEEQKYHYQAGYMFSQG